jgi:hypothetical protein
MNGWCRLDAGLLQDRPDGAGGESDSEPGEFALDASVAPGRVLARHPQDQRADLRVGCRSARPPVRVRPTPPDEGPVPATNRFGPYEDAAPPVARQQPGQCREEDPISGPAVRPSNLPPQHRQLVPQDKNLDLVRGLRPATQHDQPEQVPKQPVQTRNDHPTILPAPSAATPN